MRKQRLIPLVALFVSLLVPALSTFAGPTEAQSDKLPSPQLANGE